MSEVPLYGGQHRRNKGGVLRIRFQKVEQNRAGNCCVALFCVGEEVARGSRRRFGGGAYEVAVKVNKFSGALEFGQFESS